MARPNVRRENLVAFATPHFYYPDDDQSTDDPLQMTACSKIAWSDISQSAEEIFHVWGEEQHERELNWAKAAWNGLQKKGLTAYASEIEKALVLVRLITLATIYREFCEVAWEEVFEPEHSIWADELGISPVRVGQLLGSNQMVDDSDDSDLLETGLAHLIDQNRPEIYKALAAHFGGRTGIFVSLWKIVEFDEDEYSMVNEVTEDKGNAFQWIDQGMHRLH